MKKSIHPPGYTRATHCANVIRRMNESVEDWLVGHTGTNWDEHKWFRAEIARLKSRITRIEKAALAGEGGK
jgi:hypothetical protein